MTEESVKGHLTIRSETKTIEVVLISIISRTKIETHYHLVSKLPKYLLEILEKIDDHSYEYYSKEEPPHTWEEVITSVRGKYPLDSLDSTKEMFRKTFEASKLKEYVDLRPEMDPFVLVKSGLFYDPDPQYVPVTTVDTKKGLPSPFKIVLVSIRWDC